MAAHIIKSISALEFKVMMRDVIPPPGWSQTLAIGNSGGPDSICLLFLLNRYLRDRCRATSDSSENLAQLISLSIDHDLQASSTAMANQAAAMAELLGVKHITLKLPWGKGNYPQKPRPDDKIEEVARDMRQLVLFERMKELDVNALALGHHMDDQVETMFMRLGRGSSQTGLAGMRPCRRWGMGSKNDAGQPFGIEGMRKWVIRPLLGVGKDRILATCEEQNLDYVTDKTNFQPHLTIRNAIRHVLRHGDKSSDLTAMSSLADLPTSAMNNLTDIEEAAAGHSLSLRSALEDIRNFNRSMAAARSNVDKMVDEIIREHRIPSPPGTFMIPQSAVKTIDSPVVRDTLLFRITRYVSPEPWGHPQAELRRRKAGVNRLALHLSDSDLISRKENSSLCVGSSVWWRPVTVLPTKLSLDLKHIDLKHLAWIALRQPQIRSGHDKDNINDLSPDITEKIVQHSHSSLSPKSHKSSPAMELLYDNRFLIRFNLDNIPLLILQKLSSGAGKMMIKPSKLWAIPQVVLQIGEEVEILQTAVELDPFFKHCQLGGSRPYKDIHSGWITIQYFRPLSSI